MIPIILLLLALTGTTEDVTAQLEGVVTETCESNQSGDCNGDIPTTTTTTPTELPGPRPEG